MSRQYRKLSAHAVRLMLRQNYSFKLGVVFLYLLVIDGANLNGGYAVLVWWYLDGSQNPKSELNKTGQPRHHLIKLINLLLHSFFTNSKMLPCIALAVRQFNIS